MRSLLTLFLLLLTSAITLGQTQNTFPAGLKQAMTDYDKAWNKKDLAGVSKILSDDYVYFTSTGGLTDRKRTLEFLASPDYKLTFVERSEIVLNSYRAGTAMISSRWKGRGTFGKEVINDDQRCGLVFVKEGKAWKLLAEHCTQIASR